MILFLIASLFFYVLIFTLLDLGLWFLSADILNVCSRPRWLSYLRFSMKQTLKWRHAYESLLVRMSEGNNGRLVQKWCWAECGQELRPPTKSPPEAVGEVWPPFFPTWGKETIICALITVSLVSCYPPTSPKKETALLAKLLSLASIKPWG